MVNQQDTGVTASSAAALAPQEGLSPCGSQAQPPAANAHTPLPWAWDVTDPDPIFQTNYTIYPEADCEHSIAEVNGQINKSADVRFIVRACNAHYELLEALKALTNEAWNHMTGGAGHLIDDARAAIAKAEAV